MDKKRRVIFFLAFGLIIAIALIAVLFFINQIPHFDYNEVKFYIENESGKILYKTLLPVTYTDEMTGKATYGDYNLYFENDPRELEKNVIFSGGLNLHEYTILNITKEFEKCVDKDVLPLQNFINFNKIIGIKPIKDEVAGCDDLYGEYSWVGVKRGEETKIIEWGLKGGCYNVNIKNCDEISMAVERFMLEILVKLNK